MIKMLITVLFSINFFSIVFGQCLQKNNFSDLILSDYQTRIDNSWIKEELYKVRNFHQAFDKGLIGGLLNAGLNFSNNE